MSIPMYLGVTGYYYSDNFDGDYEEVNIGGDFGFMSFDAAVLGSYKSDADTSEYQHYGQLH